MTIDYNIVSGAEVKVNVYGGDSCEEHIRYIEVWSEGDMGSDTMQEVSFDCKRWPVGTKLIVKVPCCPNPDCDADAEFQDQDGKCTECGFDWINWAEEQYS